MIPTYGSIPLFVGTQPCSGAAFELVQPAQESAQVTLNNWEIEVIEKSPIVVARGGVDVDYESTFNSGILAAQQGLDLLSLTSRNSLLTKRFADNHLTWWKAHRVTNLRITSTSNMGFSTSATATVTDSHGNERTAASNTQRWHESLRYLRLSQATDDLFDGYRNAYLALESILSSITPQNLNNSGRPIEGEGAWLKRALNTATALVDARIFLPYPIADPADYLFEELYVNVRSAMSHAKSGRRMLLPQNASERHYIVSRLQMLLGLYFELLRVHLGASLRSSGATSHFFHRAFTFIFDDMSAVVSDDDSPMDLSNEVPNPRGGGLFELRSTGAFDASRPNFASRLWTTPTADLPVDLLIRRVVGLKKQSAAVVAVLEAPLSVGSIENLEVLLGGRGINVDQPRAHYPY